MAETPSKRSSSAPFALLGLAVAVLGFSILNSGRGVVDKWSQISAAYAACGVLWIICGALMSVGGLWVLASFGTHRLPLWLGAIGSVVAGASVVIGVLTSVVPCSGPS
jgi:hypothetical protein